MGSEWSQEKFVNYKQQLSPRNCLTAWELVELVGMDHFSLGHQALSVGINEVFQELILDVLKQVWQNQIIYPFVDPLELKTFI